MKPVELAKKLNACEAATEFVAQFGTIKEAWEACPRGDWMLWAAKKIRVDRRLLVGAAGQCARTVQHLMKDPRSLAALDACDKYATGEIGEKELSAAAAHVVAAADAAAAAAYAAYAAAHVVAAADAARKENRQKTADICRKMLTVAVFEIIDKGEV